MLSIPSWNETELTELSLTNEQIYSRLFSVPQMIRFLSIQASPIYACIESWTSSCHSFKRRTLNCLSEDLVLSTCDVLGSVVCVLLALIGTLWGVLIKLLSNPRVQSPSSRWRFGFVRVSGGAAGAWVAVWSVRRRHQLLPDQGGRAGADSCRGNPPTLRSRCQLWRWELKRALNTPDKPLAMLQLPEIGEKSARKTDPLMQVSRAVTHLPYIASCIMQHLWESCAEYDFYAEVPPNISKQKKLLSSSDRWWLFFLLILKLRNFNKYNSIAHCLCGSLLPAHQFLRRIQGKRDIGRAAIFTVYTKSCFI